LEEEIHGGGQGKRAFDRRAPIRFYNWQCFRLEIRVAVGRFRFAGARLDVIIGRRRLNDVRDRN